MAKRRRRREPERLAFSADRLQQLPRPESGRLYYHDTKRPGLCLAVTERGSKTFYVYKWAAGHGKPVRVRLGKFPDMSIAQARRLAGKLAGEIDSGRDPQDERRAAREQATLSELFGHWLDSYAREHKKTWREDVRLFRKFLKPWAARRLSTIRKTEIQKLHAQVGSESGKYQANRLLEFIAAMFNRADGVGYTGPNPAVGITPYRERSRDRFLEGDELARFFQALSEEPNDTLRDFFCLALLTGARRNNLQAMAWEDVSFERALWRIPETKSGQVVVVPLVEPAIEILKRRRDVSDSSPWVFPSKRSKTGHLVEPKSAWKRICGRAGLQDARLHDLRRTLGSWMVAGGASLPIVGKTLGHSQPRATAVYARLELSPIRGAMEAATTAMLQAGRLLPTGGQDDG